CAGRWGDRRNGSHSQPLILFSLCKRTAVAEFPPRATPQWLLGTQRRHSVYTQIHGPRRAGAIPYVGATNGVDRTDSGLAGGNLTAWGVVLYYTIATSRPR